MLTLIYALMDPRDDSVRYVGRTKDPYARMYAHLGDRRADGSPKQRWMHELRELRLRPRMAVLEAVDHSEACAAETRWIAHYAASCDLLNRARPRPPAPRPAIQRTTWPRVRRRTLSRSELRPALEGPPPSCPFGGRYGTGRRWS